MEGQIKLYMYTKKDIHMITTADTQGRQRGGVQPIYDDLWEEIYA